MDRTGIIIVSICAALLVVWFIRSEKEGARLQEQQRQIALTNSVETISAATNSTTVSTATAATTSPFATNVPEQTLVLTNNRVRYTFTSRGGGIKLIELLGYPETVSAHWKTKNSGASNGVASLNTRAPVPALAVLGDTNLIGDGNFKLTKTGYGVRAEKLLPDGLELTKEFYFSSNYLVNASVRFENTSSNAVALPQQELVVGTATPMDADDTGFYEGASWFNGSKAKNCALSYFNTNQTAFFVFHRTVKYEYREGADNVVWATAHNQYFAMLAMPKQPAEQILDTPVTLPPLAENSPAPLGIQTALIYPAQTISANSNVERQIVLYAGPKEYRILAQIGDQFQNHAGAAMQFGFFGFFAKALLSVMNWLHDVTRLSYGWTIVVLTILLRAMFWPLTAAGLRSAKKMQALAPQVKALKEKYKDEPQKFTQKQWELWRKNKVSPLSGCLPMAIQTPVFIGFYTMLRSAIELRGAHFLWVTDLSKPDTIFMIPGINFPLNLLPLLMVGVMVWQAHLQPASPGVDPSQQKMMRYMPLFFLLFLYNYSSGMALYMTVSTTLGIIQTQLIRRQMASAPPLTPPAKMKK